jgi:hypothetical protein
MTANHYRPATGSFSYLTRTNEVAIPADERDAALVELTACVVRDGDRLDPPAAWDRCEEPGTLLDPATGQWFCRRHFDDRDALVAV